MTSAEFAAIAGGAGSNDSARSGTPARGRTRRRAGAEAAGVWRALSLLTAPGSGGRLRRVAPPATTCWTSGSGSRCTGAASVSSFFAAGSAAPASLGAADGCCHGRTGCCHGRYQEPAGFGERALIRAAHQQTHQHITGRPQVGNAAGAEMLLRQFFVHLSRSILDFEHAARALLDDGELRSQSIRSWPPTSRARRDRPAEAGDLPIQNSTPAKAKAIAAADAMALRAQRSRGYLEAARGAAAGAVPAHSAECQRWPSAADLGHYFGHYFATQVVLAARVRASQVSEAQD